MKIKRAPRKLRCSAMNHQSEQCNNYTRDLIIYFGDSELYHTSYCSPNDPNDPNEPNWVLIPLCCLHHEKPEKEKKDGTNPTKRQNN